MPDSTTADNGNSKRRVANYELHTQLSEINSNVTHLIQRFDEACERSDKIHDDHEKRIRTVEKSVTTMKERQGIIVAGQSTLTLIGSVIAGWFGARQ
jgi:hypothetical protein